MICEKCSKDIKQCNFKKHYKVCKGVVIKKSENCPYCKITRKDIIKSFQSHVRWCEQNPNKKPKKEKRKLLSKEEKSKITSEAMKKCHAEGRHPGWSFINSNKERRSYPEKVIYNFLLQNNIIEKYKIIEKFPFKKYFLDFAFVDICLDLEIDGEYHYKDEKSIEHDKKRNEILESNGWKVYRIRWKDFINDKINQFDIFLEYLKNYNNENSVYYDVKNLINKRNKFNSREDFLLFKKKDSLEKYNLKYEKFLPVVLESNIDFKKLSWVKQMQDLGIKDPRRFLKFFLPEIYKKCFLRQGKGSQYDTKWIYNLELKQNKKIKKYENLPMDWQEGRKYFKK